MTKKTRKTPSEFTEQNFDSSIIQELTGIQKSTQDINHGVQGLTVTNDQWMFDLSQAEVEEVKFDESLLDSPLDDLTLEELEELYPCVPSYTSTVAIADMYSDVFVPGYSISVLSSMPNRVAPVSSSPVFYIGALLRVLIAIARAVGGTVGKLLLRLLGLGRPITKILEARRALQAARGLTGVPEWAKQIFIQYASRNFRQVLIRQVTILTAEIALIGVTLKQYYDYKKQAEAAKRQAEELDRRIQQQLQNPQNDPETRRQLEEIKTQNDDIMDQLNDRLREINGRIGELEREQETKQGELDENQRELDENTEDSNGD